MHRNGNSAENDKNSCEFGLKSGVFEIPGDISSQFITGLIFALSCLSGDSTIEIIPPVESRPYIDLTIMAFKEFNVARSVSSETDLLSHIRYNCLR